MSVDRLTVRPLIDELQARLEVYRACDSLDEAERLAAVDRLVTAAAPLLRLFEETLS